MATRIGVVMGRAHYRHWHSTGTVGTFGAAAAAASALGLDESAFANALALAAIRKHLGPGYDVVLGQSLARTAFIESLETVARDAEASFFEFVLDLDPATLAARLAARSSTPDRPEHLVNNRLVTAQDAKRLVASMARLREHRPGAARIDAGGSISATLEAICALLA